MLDPLAWVRAAHYASMIQLAGIFAFLSFVAEPVFRRVTGAEAADIGELRTQLVRLAWISLAAGFASGGLWLVLVAAEMSGEPLRSVLSNGLAATVLTATQFGRDWELRFVLASGLVYCLAFLGSSDRRTRGAVGQTGALLLSAIDLAALAWAGHAAGTAGLAGGIHRSADAIHLLAAGAWLGGLVPLALLFSHMRRARDPAWAAVARSATLRFSALGIASVAAVLLTGIVNAWFLVGTIPRLVDTEYGRLLLAKIGVFAAMVGIAAFNRLRLTPLLLDRRRQAEAWTTLGQLRRNSLIEASLGLVLLIIVGALGILMPAVHHVPAMHHDPG